MKNLMKIFLIVFGSIMIFSCVPRHKPHHIPPGQAKKIMKSKSARPYAPGQVKKMHKSKPPKHNKRRER